MKTSLPGNGPSIHGKSQKKKHSTSQNADLIYRVVPPKCFDLGLHGCFDTKFYTSFDHAMKPLLFQHQFLRNLLTIQYTNMYFNTRFSTAFWTFNEATFVSTPRFAPLLCWHAPGNAPVLGPVSTISHFDMFSITGAQQSIYIYIYIYVRTYL